MTHQELYDFIKNNINDHTNKNGKPYFADKYVQSGYGQIKGGYFNEAYIRDKEIHMCKAEPSQKWHLLVSYYDYKIENSLINMNEPANLFRIQCPQLMIWIAEIAGLNSKILENAINNAIIYEKTKLTKNSRLIKKDVLNKDLFWKEITNFIKLEKTWQDVVNKVKLIK